MLKMSRRCGSRDETRFNGDCKTEARQRNTSKRYILITGLDHQNDSLTDVERRLEAHQDDLLTDVQLRLIAH